MKDYTKEEIKKIKFKRNIVSNIKRYLVYCVCLIILFILINALVKNITRNNTTIKIFDKKGYIIQDNSFSSVAKRNDIIICKNDKSDIKENDIVIYKDLLDGDRILVSKITEIRKREDGSYKYVAKNDRDEEVSLMVDDIQGIYESKISKVGYIYITHPSIVGLYIFIVLSFIMCVYNDKNKKEERAISRHEIRMRYESAKNN